MSAARQRIIIAINLKFDFIIQVSTAVEYREGKPISMHNNQYLFQEKCRSGIQSAHLD
jgi:hypothetical protein